MDLDLGSGSIGSSKGYFFSRHLYNERTPQNVQDGAPQIFNREILANLALVKRFQGTLVGCSAEQFSYVCSMDYGSTFLWNTHLWNNRVRLQILVQILVES